MALHTEINPNPDTLPLDVATEALRLARRGLTRNVGTVQIPNPNGDDLIFGEGADDGANWVDGDGNQSPLVDTEFFKQGIEQANQEITVINGRLDQMDSEADQLQEHIDSVRREAQENFETAKTTADAAAQKADAVSQEVADFRTEVGETVQIVKDSVSGVRSDVDAVTQKAADLASELDGTKATVEQVVTEQGELRTTVSNAVEKADQSLRVSTQASQTATQAQTTATSAYEDAQTAITQSSQATQTANQVSLDLRTNYQTKADADAKYATQASLTATSEQIRTEVSETYATQATVNALENLANNAVQTWMGDGVPTLSNKPASDWTTNELRKQHSGDLYYDTDTGYSYRFGSNDGANYSWALVKDTDITKALADAAKAQETAEGAQSGVNELKTSIPVTYATKSELSQKADSITARVEEVAQAGETTSNKVAELELTADGLQTTVKEQASKIDRNATTISQVSQKADSLSSTITQVSGRVDDVDAKADTAQETANSAMSQASRVEQSLDSFKTSVSRDYQTKTDALSQKSELEQNINSFKTTVSETYTTKDEFNALEIGGTNLIRGSKPYDKSGFFKHFDSVTDNEYGEVTLQSTTTSQSYPHVELDFADTFTFDKTDIVTGDKYVISYDVMMLERTYTASSTFTENWIGIRHGADDWSGILQYNGIKNDFLSAPLNEWAHFEHPITAKSWNGTSSINAGIQLGTKSVGKFRFRMRNVKLEKGTKGTAWSPAPEDFDGKYTSKTEFKQTTDKISATATAASQNASSALSKISSLEVSVDGIDTRVEEVASDADEAIKTASQVSQRVDSLSSTITQVQGDIDRIDANSQNFITNPQFKSGNADGVANTNMNATDSNPGVLPGTATTFGKNFSGYDNRADKVKIKFVKNHTYRIEIDARLASDNAYTGTEGLGLFFWFMAADNPGLSANQYTGYNANLIPSGTKEWTHASYDYTPTMGDDDPRIVFRPAYRVAPGSRWLVTNFTCTDVTEIAEAQKDADTANDTANSALSKSSSVEQNLNSFKTSVSQTYETKSDASSKQSSLQQSVNNLRTEVSETYTTKDEFNALEIGGTNLIRGSANGGSDYSPGNGSMRNDGYLGNGAVHTNRAWYGYYIRMKNIADRGDVKTGDTVTLSIYVSTSSSSEVTNSFGLYRAKPTDYGVIGNVTLKSGRWERLTATFAINDASALTNSARFECTTDTNYDILWSCPQVEIGTKPTDWSPCPADMLSSDQAAQTYSTKSYVDQTSRTVSLGVVEEYKNGQHGSALATASDITAAKDSIKSTVSQTYLSKSSASSTYATKTQVQQTSDSLTVKIGNILNNPTSDNLWPNQWFDDDKPLLGSAGTENPPSGGKSRLLAGRDYYNGSVMAPVYPGHRYRITADAKRTAGSVALKAGIWYTKQTSGHSYDSYTASTSSSSLGNDWNRYTWEVTVPSGKQAGSLYFQLEQNASGGSTKWLVGNAILQDITAAYNAQSTANTANSNAQNAQSTANTANSNAQNAQNRVGNLETCIKMTAQGVRVGKVSNGNFTGYSALVNSNGSFDVLNGDTTVTRFAANSISIPSSNNGNSDARLQLTSAGYDLAFTRNGTTYYFRLGSGGIGIHAPDGSYVDVGSGGIAVHAKDGSYMDLSSGKGLTLETKTLGKLSIGSGGLQFTNDQSWGFQLSVTGWSIKWAGNHTLATGDEAGALYIDGRKIQVV